MPELREVVDIRRGKYERIHVLDENDTFVSAHWRRWETPKEVREARKRKRANNRRARTIRCRAPRIH